MGEEEEVVDLGAGCGRIEVASRGPRLLPGDAGDAKPRCSIIRICATRAGAIIRCRCAIRWPVCDANCSRKGARLPAAGLLIRPFGSPTQVTSSRLRSVQLPMTRPASSSPDTLRPPPKTQSKGGLSINLSCILRAR